MTMPRRGRGREHKISQAISKSCERSPLESSAVPSPASWNVDRGRSRVRQPSNQSSEQNLRRRGYHSFMSSFGKIFHVEKRWRLVREMGSGAYGVVISAADEISGEIVAIKLVTRVFDKVQLAKRALREITLLRHFANHENITGLIDLDAMSSDFNEIYIFMEPMEADLNQIIRSEQPLTNEHVQYFVYQILRGMKYIHSASVIHRDLKPGNLLVNADCELKICDFGLSRGFNAEPDENASHLTEYVATRWYRAPEIMLAFRRYNTAIDVWSIGCIFAELFLGRPIFKGKDYVDQLNKILEILGTPEESLLRRIASEKAQAYVRSLPIKKAVPLHRIIPAADHQGIDLLSKMLKFDPNDRITVPEALEHPWLSSYHDANDEPDCPSKFDKWRKIERLETLDQFRDALWSEIEDYRMEVRGLFTRPSNAQQREGSSNGPSSDVGAQIEAPLVAEQQQPPTAGCPPTIMADESATTLGNGTLVETAQHRAESPEPIHERRGSADVRALSAQLQDTLRPSTPADPVMTYARRSSMLGSSRQGSVVNSPVAPTHNIDGQPPGSTGTGSVPFPSTGYVVPVRSRTASTTAVDPARKLLRTLSTVSISESVEGLPRGLAGVAPIGRYIVNRETEADGPPSEMPREFGIEETEELESENGGLE